MKSYAFVTAAALAFAFLAPLSASDADKCDCSIDGRSWFPASIAGRDVQASSANGYIEVASVRYVRVGWPPGSNVPSPGPRVTAQVQVSY